MRYLLICRLFCLMIFSIIKLHAGYFIDQSAVTWSEDKKLKIYEIITQDRYISELDLQKQLNPYGMKVRWLPDTLYQLLQLSFFDPASQPEQAPWEKDIGSGNRFDKYNKLDQRTELFTRLNKSFYHLNEIILEKGLINKSSDELLDIVFNNLPESQINQLVQLKIHIAELAKRKSLFKRIINKEEEAHREGAFLLWRYSNGVHDFLDLVIDARKLYDSPKGKREIVFRAGTAGLSYAYTILSGMINDSLITPLLVNAGTSACTFSYLLTNELAPDSLKVKSAALYNIKINKKDLIGNEKITNRYVYLPALSFDQDIFGHKEMFHPRWILDTDTLLDSLIAAHEPREKIEQKEREAQRKFICDHLKRMTKADVIYIDNQEFFGDMSTLKVINSHINLEKAAQCVN